jgi:hypothetical protein
MADRGVGVELGVGVALMATAEFVSLVVEFMITNVIGKEIRATPTSR